MNKEGEKIEAEDRIIKRLDAIIRLLIEMNKPEVKRELNEAVAARILKSVGLAPTEIAKIMGKKSATDISYALYPKQNIKKTKGA